MVIGTALRWPNSATVALSVALAFFFGYALTVRPLLAAQLPLRRALGPALAADTLSITIMEIVDNTVMLVVPGALDAGLTTLLFWATLAGSLILAGVAAYPANRWLILRGRGHALVHEQHSASGHSPHH